MTSKEKFYRDKRRTIMRNIVLLTEDLLLGCPKAKLKFIDLSFLKYVERRLIDYQKLLNADAKNSEKIGENSV